jgi:hypothetical protein
MLVLCLAGLWVAYVASFGGDERLVDLSLAM